MQRTVRIRVTGRGAETDAPTVDDFLDQIEDYFGILGSVEAALAEDGGNALEWRIIRASKRSPLSIQAAAFSRHFGVNIDRRASAVVEQTAKGLCVLATSGERPMYFRDEAITKAERIVNRVTNGLGLTEFDHGPGLPRLRLTPRIAQETQRKVRALLAPTSRPYKELGSIEGFFRRVERDGFGRAVLWIHHRLTGEEVKCLLTRELRQELRSHPIGEVWDNRRVMIHGLIHYRALGRIRQVDADDVRFLRSRHELPGLEAIFDEDFTGGMRSEEYLERLRDGDIS